MSDEQQQQQPMQTSSSGFAVAILHNSNNNNNNNNNNNSDSVYDIVNASSTTQPINYIVQQQVSGSGGTKSVGQAVSDVRCAFHNSDCRRQQQQAKSPGQLVGNAALTTTPVSIIRLAPSSDNTDNWQLRHQPVIASTTGGSNNNRGHSMQYNASPRSPTQTSERPQWLTVTPTTSGAILFRQQSQVSPLAQPLPPWGDDENHALFISPSLASDIARIKSSSSSSPPLSHHQYNNNVQLNRQTSNQSSIFVAPSIGGANQQHHHHHHQQSVKSPSSISQQHQLQHQHQAVLLPSSGLLGRLVQLTTPSTPTTKTLTNNNNNNNTLNDIQQILSFNRQRQATTLVPPFRASNFTPTVFAGQRITPLTPQSMNANSNFFSPIIMRQEQQAANNKSPQSFNNNNNNGLSNSQQFVTTTHVPPMFQKVRQQQQQQTDSQPVQTDQQATSKSLQQQQQLTTIKQRAPIQVQSSNFPRPPSSFRKQKLQQVQIDNNGSLGANFDLNPANGSKQARKLVQVQQQQQQQGGTVVIPTAGSRLYFQSSSPSSQFITSGSDSGDSSTVTAGTNNNNINFNINNNSGQTSGKLLASLLTPAQQVAKLRAANQLLLMQSASSNQNNQTTVTAINDQRLVAPATSAARAANSLVKANLVRSTSNGEYYQNRTIAEIMEDSGLKLDGQVVTFNKLRDCLAESGLLSLIMHTSKPLTIFMPTDQAFQRLVQHQQSIKNNINNNGLINNDLMLGTSYVPMKRINNGNNNFPSLISAASTGQQNQQDESAGFSSPLLQSSHQQQQIDCSSQQAKQLLLDHLSVSLMTPKDLNRDTIIASVSNRNLILSSIPDKKIVVIDGQPVVAATRAKDGMVYVVNKFINITNQLPTVVDVINQHKNLTTFASYLRFSGFESQLKKDSGPITILAPTNDAFDQLSHKAMALLNSDPAALLDIIKGHIVDGAQFGKLISMRISLPTLNAGQSVTAKNIKPNVYLLDDQMTIIKLVGSSGNGVVNSIDKLIVPGWLRESFKSSSQPEINNTTSWPVGDREIDQSSPDIVRSGRFEPGTINQFNQPIMFRPTTQGSLIFDVSTQQPFKRQEINNNTSPSTITSIFNAAANNQSSSAARGRNNINNSTGSSRNMQLIEELASMMSANKFVKLLHKAQSELLLKQATNYVILVPTDQAIDKLPKQIIQMLERNNQKLEDLVNYHILETTFEYINMIPDGQTLNTINDKDIVFNWYRNNTILTASGSVVLSGVQEDNIALLLVDRVLYPTPGNIMDIISKSPILSNLTKMVRNTGLDQQLSKSGPFTLFAPSDYAFSKLSSNDREFLNRDRDAARRFLLRHLSQPTVFTSAIALSNVTTILPGGQLVPKLSITNSLGDELALRQMNDYFSVKDVNFSYSDVAATNGVIHVIDGTL